MFLIRKKINFPRPFKSLISFSLLGGRSRSLSLQGLLSDKDRDGSLAAFAHIRGENKLRTGRKLISKKGGEEEGEESLRSSLLM